MRQLSITYLPMQRLRSGLFWAFLASALAFAVILVSVAVLVLSTGSASAAETTSNSLDTIVQRYQQAAQSWESTLKTYAQTLFWLLATIEITLAGIRLVLKGSDFSEWASELVNQILYIGFFAALLQNSTGTNSWASVIVQSFRNAANSAVQGSGGASMMAPSDIFGIGLSMANKVLDQTSIWSPGSSVGLIIFALVLLVCFALIAAFLVLALVESYIVISAGVIFMGFGGSRFTKDYALKILIYAMSVGAKLFVMQLIVGLGQQIFNQLMQNFQTNTSDLFVAVGSAIVMLALTKIIPDMIQGLLNGVSAGNGGVLSGMVAGAAAGTAAGVASSVMAGGSAYSLASSQSGVGGLRGFPGNMARAAGNLASAAYSTVGDRLSGRAHFGTFGGQMARSMDEKADDLKKK